MKIYIRVLSVLVLVLIGFSVFQYSQVEALKKELETSKSKIDRLIRTMPDTDDVESHVQLLQDEMEEAKENIEDLDYRLRNIRFTTTITRE